MKLKCVLCYLAGMVMLTTMNGCSENAIKTLPLTTKIKVWNKCQQETYDYFHRIVILQSSQRISLDCRITSKDFMNCVKSDDFEKCLLKKYPGPIKVKNIEVE